MIPQLAAVAAVAYVVHRRLRRRAWVNGYAQGRIDAEELAAS